MFKNTFAGSRYLPLLVVLLVTSQISTSYAQNLPLDPKVRRGVLPNGFTYYIRHNETPKGRVVFNFVVKAGSILEDNDQSGLAHFMEHMSFNGTKHFPKNHLVDYLQQNGLRFGADINAYTGFDETVYQLPLTSNIEILRKGLLIIRDWAQEASLDNEEIKKERGVILEEKRTQMGAGQRLQLKYTPMLFNYSRYADRNPIGTDSNLKSFPPSAIRRFYKDWYRPDLQAIIAVGDFDAAQMERMIKASFGSLKNPVHQRPRIKYAIGLSGKNGFVALEDPEVNSVVAQVVIKHRAPEMKTKAEYKLAIVTRLFNRIVGQRLKALYTSDSAKVLQANASINPLMGGLDNFAVNIVARPGKLKEGVGAVWTEIERIRQFGFKPKELELAKQIYQNGMENGFKEKNSISSASFVQEYVAHFLRGSLAPGFDNEYQLVTQFLAEINVQDLDHLARAYIRKDNMDIILTGPENSGFPSETIFKSWMSAVDIKENQDQGKTGVAAAKPLLRLAPVPGKVIAMTNDQSGISTITLSNGITVILKPTRFKNDEILFSGFSPGGTSLYTDHDYQSAKNAAGIVSSSGAGNYNYKELEEYLSGKQMGVQPFISELSQGVSGGSTAGNIGAALELAYAYLTEPVIDKTLFQQLISRRKIAVAGRSKDPGTVFQDSIAAILSNHHPRRMPVTDQKLNEIDIDRAEQIYKERFSDLTGMTFTFVGSFNTDSIRPLLEKYIAALPSKGTKSSFRDLGIGLPAPKIDRVIKKGIGTKARVELFYTGAFNYEFKERMKLDALKGVLELRLTERLREEESGVYSPAVSLSLDKIPQKEFKILLSFECAPENTQRLIKATLDEITQLKANGPSAVNLQKFKMESIRSREIEIRSNQWWLGYLAGQLEDGEPLNDDQLYLQNLNHLDPSGLKISAQQYLKPENFSQFILLPEQI